MTHLTYLAFPTPTGGGNPAGVVLDASDMEDAAMQALAAELGYSETAFLRRIAEREYAIRYFSPVAEVDFCGHATIAASVALAEDRYREGALLLHAHVGEIPIELAASDRGPVATLTSVTPDDAALVELDALLAILGWSADDLDPSLPQGLAFAGLWHPVLWAASRERLADLDYDFDALAALMRAQGWGTVSLLHRESPSLVHSRNAFPIGGVIEDPATGAAAAALGGFLRAHELLPQDGRFTVLQGEDMGQPCLLEVDASGDAGVRVSGSARRLETLRDSYAGSGR